MLLVKNNNALVEQPFHSVPLGEALKHHTLQPGDFVCWKRHLQKSSLQPHWKGPPQVLVTRLFATNLQGIDTWIDMTHLKKLPNTY